MPDEVIGSLSAGFRNAEMFVIFAALFHVLVVHLA